jgi:hypothetical protein
MRFELEDGCGENSPAESIAEKAVEKSGSFSDNSSNSMSPAISPDRCHLRRSAGVE